MKRIANQKGSSLVLVAVTIIAMLAVAALAMDFGRGAMWRTRIQKAADSAALAGAMELPFDPEAAYVTAVEYCAKNGIAESQMQVSFPVTPPSRIRVALTYDMGILFAGILGRSSGEISTAAEAETGVIGAMRGVVPVGVVKRDFVFGETYVLKRGTSSCSDTGSERYCSNFGPLALGGSGASVYEDNIKYGYDGVLTAGQWVPTEPGNMVGPTGQGVRYRIELSPDQTYLNINPGSSRLIYVPVLESLDVNGRNEVLVTGFAAFFLEDYAGGGEISGKFLRYHTPGSIEPVGQENFGLYGIRLLK